MSPEIRAAVLSVLAALLVMATMRALRSHAIRRALRSDDPAKRAHARELARHFRMRGYRDGDR
jgi:hypothetical protein